MTVETTELIGGVFCDVLARMAFMFGDSAGPADLPTPAGGAVLAAMTFRGARRGSLTLAAADGLCPELAANVLGLEPQEAQALDRSGDAFQELLNVTCGHVLTAVAGESAVFDLDAPQLSRLDEAGWTALRDAPGAVGFVVEGHPVLLRLQLDD